MTTCEREDEWSEMSGSQAVVPRLAATSERSKLLLVQESSRSRSGRLLRYFLDKSPVATVLVLLQSEERAFEGSCAQVLPLLESEAEDWREELLHLAESGAKRRLVIDSLNPLLLRYSLEQVRDLLTRLTRACDSVVATLFDAVTDSRQRSLLRRLATTYLLLQQDSLALLTIKRRHRSLGVKVERRRELLRWSGQQLHAALLPVTRVHVTKETTSDQSKATQARLPFLRSVSESQRLWPEGQGLEVESEAGARLHYTPDEMDDFDDEDPDEDLGI